MSKFELAACVLIPTGRTAEEILAVSRRNSTTQWGIPGGKQDPGESNVQCACRELQEEIGIEVKPEDLIPLYTGPCYGADGHNFWVTSYLLNGAVTGQPADPEEGLLVKPMELDYLCQLSVSPFSWYNEQVKFAWRLLK